VWQGDSLAFVPYPRMQFVRGEHQTDAAARYSAAVHQRALFGRIARSWATALPNSPGTKEAVAIALDMVGDLRALDTLQVARSLVRDPMHQLRLVAEEVFLRTAFSRKEPRHLRLALALADSVLAAHPAPNPDYARILAPIAALLGRCSLAGSLSTRDLARFTVGATGVSALDAQAESITIHAALGCRVERDRA
jgi:hypothetical protein